MCVAWCSLQLNHIDSLFSLNVNIKMLSFAAFSLALGSVLCSIFCLGFGGVGFEVWIFFQLPSNNPTSRWSRVILLLSPQNKKWLFWVSLWKVCAICWRLGTHCMQEESCQGLDQGWGLVRNRRVGRRINHQADLRNCKASNTFSFRAMCTFSPLLARSWNNYLKNKENCFSQMA